MAEDLETIRRLVLKAAEKARKETSGEPEPELTKPIRWPVSCTVGPGLEGAIACASKVGYVNGSKGRLYYRGYDVFDLCAQSTFEEVAYLVMRGKLPTASQLEAFKRRLAGHRYVPKTLRVLMGFPVEEMNTMAALRLGTNLMRQEFTFVDREAARPDVAEAIQTDEDSIPMETVPRGEARAIYEFRSSRPRRRLIAREALEDVVGLESCYHLVAGVASLTAAIARIRQGQMPIDPDPGLSHAGNFLYMLRGERPTAMEERIMDIALILHIDHGMNASTFASMVVASTLSDIYLSVGSGIAALTGPLHGGANERVVQTLREIGDAKNVKAWYERARAKKRKIMGFGHRVYKAYDPRARVLGPLVKCLARRNPEVRDLMRTAQALEKEVVATLGQQKGVYPNVDFYSGLVYLGMGIPPELFTPIFAVARVVGWTARVMEYLENNRIFRPRAMYVGPLNRVYVPLSRRGGGKDKTRGGKR